MMNVFTKFSRLVALRLPEVLTHVQRLIEVRTPIKKFRLKVNCNLNSIEQSGTYQNDKILIMSVTAQFKQNFATQATLCSGLLRWES